MILQIINVFGKILLMIFLGFILTRRHILTEEMKKNLSSLLMKAVLPASIISSAGQNFSMDNGLGMLQVFLIACIYYIVTIVLVGRMAGKYMNKEQSPVFIDLVVFANVGFIGFPLMGEMLGNVGTLYTIAYNMAYQLFFFSYGLLILKKGGGLSLKGLLKNGIIYVSAASMILYFSNIRFPEFLQSTLSDVGAMMVPLSMILIGYDIASMDLRKLYREKLPYLVSFFRMIIFPLAMLIIMRCMNMEYHIAAAVILLTGLPSGSLTVIAAGDHGRDTGFAACAVAQSTLFMIVVLPLFTLLISYIWLY